MFCFCFSGVVQRKFQIFFVKEMKKSKSYLKITSKNDCFFGGRLPSGRVSCQKRHFRREILFKWEISEKWKVPAKNFAAPG